MLVVGGSGELGGQVVRAASGWDVHATYFTRSGQAAGAVWHPLDVADRQSVQHLVRELRPDVIIHAAVSDRDQAKFSSQAEYRAAVVDGACYLAEAAAQTGARCVILSTDLVFDGRQGNYVEEDAPNPIMPYGQAKADMEQALLSTDADLVVVRTSLILTLEPPGRHVTWIVDALRQGERRDLFTDELRCPIWSDELAAALLELAGLSYRGLLHIAGLEVTHRYALGLSLAGYFGLDPALIRPALSAESGLNRPLDCTLNCERAYALLKTPIHGISDRLGRSANMS
ncbi:MAG: SDR family oxidoreductase [Anaerolineae bacterium]